jgi:hypothetical protein
VHRPEQGNTSGGKRDEVVFTSRAGRGLLGRLGDPPGQRRAGKGVGELGEGGNLSGLRTKQPGDKGLVAGIDSRESFVKAVNSLDKDVGTHHTTARVGGNHCISGTGAVVGASSR